MAFQDARLRLEHILQAVDAIREFTKGKTLNEYCVEAITRDAVERNIERISEASRRGPDDVKLRTPEIPWRLIAGIGDILRHDYDGVDDAAIWNLVQNDLEPLRAAAERLLVELDQP
jgi:uncharacterized protein with HEPN domain